MTKNIKSVTSLDPVAISFINNKLNVLLKNRSTDDKVFPGMPGLPGGVLLESDDSLDNAVNRLVLSRVKSISYTEQLYSRINHDPRGPTVSIAYMVIIKSDQAELIDKDCYWQELDNLPDAMAFDHKLVIDKCLNRLVAKSNYSILPAYLMSDDFTIPELQVCYEKILGVKLDKSTFYSIISSMNALDNSGQRRLNSQTRPPTVYRIKTLGCNTSESLPLLPKNISKEVCK